MLISLLSIATPLPNRWEFLLCPSMPLGSSSSPLTASVS